MRRLAVVLLALFAAGGAAAAELPRNQVVLQSAISVDAEANTVTLPLFRGTSGGQTVWYIVTDSSDAGDASARGVVHAPLLAYAGHVQTVTRHGDRLQFPAVPDFSPGRRLVPGPQGFPPSEAAPGADAPAAYSPFVRLYADGPVLNAPVVATGDGPFDIAGHSNVMDRVLAIDTQKRTVTLLLSHGFAEGRRVVYISTDASDPVAAALERAVHVPALGDGSADVALLVLAAAPQQGMAGALKTGGLAEEARLRSSGRLDSPLNVLTAFPTGKTRRGYSPSWRITMLKWQAGASPRQLTGQAEIWSLIKTRQLTGPDGADPQPTEMVVNCPVIAWVDGPVP
jgi:hypothetical protein